MYLIQQTSFNLTSSILEVLIIQHLRTAVPRLKVLLLPEKKSFLNEKAHLWTCSERPPSVSEHQLLWYLLDTLCPTPSTSSATNTPRREGGSRERQTENPDDSEPAGGGNIQM